MEGYIDSTEVLFWEALALLVTAILLVTLFKRLGLSSILGYLAAGLLVGPVSRVVVGGEELLHIAEFGVTLLLFVIGLELRPFKLWAMRADIFGLGLAQVAGCGMALGWLAALFGLDWRAAVVVGFGLALSSTALVMQNLGETRETAMPHGRKAFAILLFQDLAIVPLLLTVALLRPGGEDVSAAVLLRQFGAALAAVAVLVAAGRYLLNPMFRLLAATGLNEIMTAAALAIVIGAAMLMDVVGMSYAMGAFIAGVMLAESNYRHELEANIEPFRGLFLGLFFMAVGMSIDLVILLDFWWVVLLAVPVGMAVKAVVIYGFMRAFRSPHDLAVRIALMLPQYGEFGFVLFSSAATAAILDPAIASVLVAIITLSMALSPFAAKLVPLFLSTKPRVEIEEDFSDAAGRALVIGFGRFGQIVAQMLLARDIPVTIIDADAERVREAGLFGFHIYYGDGTRLHVLRAAGATDAAILCVCVDGREASDRIVDLAQSEFPGCTLLVRSFDRRHTIALRQRGVDYELRETYESALAFGFHALEALGLPQKDALETLSEVRERDANRLDLQVESGLYAGRNVPYRAAVKPEPLVRPRRASKIFDASNSLANNSGDGVEDARERTASRA